jgi:CRP-like cAMP-binding protein
MKTDCTHCPLRGRRLFQPMTAEEVAYMTRFKSGELRVDPGTTLLMEGSNSPQLFTVLNGMGLRYKLLPDGRRQVVNFVFPGDFLGLQAGVMGEMRHSVEATTRMTLCVFNRADLFSLFRQQPPRAFDLTWLAAIEEHFLGEALSFLGQRSAIRRMAWALAKIYRRARALDLGQGQSCPMPWRQVDLADALGLSLVHTNKTLARLRERQIASWSNGTLTVLDAGALAELAEMDLDDVEQRPLI